MLAEIGQREGEMPVLRRPDELPFDQPRPPRRQALRRQAEFGGDVAGGHGVFAGFGHEPGHRVEDDAFAVGHSPQ